MVDPLTQEKRRNRGSRPGAGRAARTASAADGCASCGASPVPQASFCHRCGAPLADRPADTWTTRRLWIVASAAAALSIAVAVLTMSFLVGSDRGAPTPATVAGAAQRAASKVDLSKMDPREAADRLFNRVMSAKESGDMQEATRFAPMAVQAYGRVAALDADARYHLGLLHLVLGDLDAVRGQIEALMQQVPGHLLALLLEHDVAVRAGDHAAAARAVAAFVASDKVESVAARPEYQAHQGTIARFRAANAVPGGVSAVASGAAPASDDAALFERRCSACHGIEAAGTDKGPPLVHRIYEPGHHGDQAFYRAVREGVRSHHWPFGDMAPVPGVSEDEIARIVAYVRKLQRANGIQ